MMNVPKILPSGFTEVSAEQILHTYNRSPKVIYLSVLILIITGLTSLFFVKVDVSIRAQGVIKTMGERVYPKASGSGYLQYLNPLLKENAAIKAGDTLIVIGREEWNEQLMNAAHRENELNGLLADLAILIGLPHKEYGEAYNEVPVFHTDVYRQNHQLFRYRHQSHVQHFLAVQKNYERDKRLFEQQVIAPADFERTLHEYDKAVLGLSTLYGEQMNQWRQEQQKYRNERIDIQSSIVQLTIQKQELTVLAPVSGSVQQLPGLKVGNYVTQGEILMEISPDGAFHAECYVSPRDIGLIRIGQQALLQIDAFNYNEWGMLQAQVSDIAHDVVLLDGQPFFKVFCTPQRTCLSLKNGYTGQLKKGMTFSVRFKLTRRTLFQWLYDKADHWLNPNMTTKA
ncbi:MAG: HlyD family efflux transporter periplasmic adaptor subunit [Bacteroidales bacterium]|nr:HlyD family efflux transporter periplasmic adaptor subunit [Bacteroidales bacterium]MCL2738856.1 HlyD family efflux transporter periplasmic adaptor subunit [Bacteroidales bacterium]